MPNTKINQAADSRSDSNQKEDIAVPSKEAILQEIARLEQQQREGQAAFVSLHDNLMRVDGGLRTLRALLKESNEPASVPEAPLPPNGKSN